MVIWERYVSDETMGTIAPIFVYWFYAGTYQFLRTPLRKFRLHSCEEEKRKNLVDFFTVIRGVFIQQLLQVFITQLGFLITTTTYAEETLNFKPLLQLQPSLPIQILQILLAMFIFDTCQYFTHRFMHHNKFLYRHVHSHHHRLVVPYAIGALYNHPVETIFDMLGGAAAFFTSGMTPRTSIWFFCLITIKTVDDHCGLKLPGNVFHILFNNNGAYHDVHHQVNGVKYNYSQPFFSFWDRVMGTYMPYYVLKLPQGGFQVKMKKS